MASYNINDVRCTFFGTTSIFITDGTTAIFFDAFLTRPALDSHFLEGEIAPDPLTIRDCLAQGRVDRLDALFVAHSHFDHVMDAPEVVKQIGGTLYWSESTLNVGRGWDLDESAMRRFAHGDTYTIGDFQVNVLQSEHSPGNVSAGDIEQPLQTPAKASSYADGGCFSFHIIHQQGSILLHPSANSVHHQFDHLACEIDMLYLGIGTFGQQDTNWQERYWHDLVDVVQPRMIIPIHWDNIFLPLSQSLEPLPSRFDNFASTKEFIERKTSSKTGSMKCRVVWQDRFETILPFNQADYDLIS